MNFSMKEITDPNVTSKKLYNEWCRWIPDLKRTLSIFSGNIVDLSLREDFEFVKNDNPDYIYYKEKFNETVDFINKLEKEIENFQNKNGVWY